MAHSKSFSVDDVTNKLEGLAVRRRQQHKQSIFDKCKPPAHIFREASLQNVCDQHAFCAAFYHVYKQGNYQSKFEYECLIKQNNTSKGCRITDNAGDHLLKQPKDVALLAVLQENGEIIWISSFTNCCQCIYDMYGRKMKKHAEDFLLEDATSNNKNSLGSVLKGFQSSDRKSRVLTLYITYQPCHKSAQNSLQKSCTETVKKFYNELLKPKGVILIIKPTHILKAYWNIKNKQCISEKEIQTAKEVQNAKRGMKILADFQIAENGKFALEAMTKYEWYFLARIFNVQLTHINDGTGQVKIYNYANSERRKLDEFVSRIVQGFLQDAIATCYVKRGTRFTISNKTGGQRRQQHAIASYRNPSFQARSPENNGNNAGSELIYIVLFLTIIIILANTWSPHDRK